LQAGQRVEAFLRAEATGWTIVQRRSDANTLLQLADVARFRGDDRVARRLLLSIRERFGDSEAASIAAFNLGRIAVDARGDSTTGLRWFSTYLDERPHGPLAREAMGRKLELLERLGPPAEARTTACAYLKRYPSGPYVGLAGRLCSPR